MIKFYMYKPRYHNITRDGVVIGNIRERDGYWLIEIDHKTRSDVFRTLAAAKTFTKGLSV